MPVLQKPSLVRGRLSGRRLTVLLATVLVAGSVSAGPVASAPPADPAASQGYWLAGADGSVFGFGAAVAKGAESPKAGTVVGMTPTSTGKGYWMVARDGGIFSFGDAAFLGSTGGVRLNEPVVGMAPTPRGRGYWLVAADGGIFSFGDAPFLGSTGALELNKPIVGMAATPTGRGYWLAASDGGVFSFGDAAFYGSTGNMSLNRPIVGMAATPTGRGYWFVAADGGIFNFGDARFWGSTGGSPLARPIAAMAALPLLPGTDTTVPPAAASPSTAPSDPAPTAAPAAEPTDPAPSAPAPPADVAPVDRTRFEIALLGDTGYSSSQDKTLLKIRDDINRFPLAFVTHDGDIWSEGTACSTDNFLRVRDVFDGFAHPLMYTPGDNEWTDCDGSTSKALTFIRNNFYPGGQTLGQRRMNVARQDTYIENARWSVGGVVFATINWPGSDGKSGSHRDAAIDWLNAAFDQAEATGAPGVMVIWQDNPFEPSGGRLAKLLKERTIAFGKPVVLVHGDTHRYRVDHPWGEAKNFTRLETHGDTSSAVWVRGTVDPNSPDVFSFKTQRAGRDD